LRQVCHAIADLVLTELLLLQSEGDILLHGHVRKQRIGLEHHVDRSCVGRYPGHVRTVDEDASRARLLESREHAQQSTFAAAGTAEQTEELALVDIQRYPVDGIGRVEYLGDVVDVYEGFGRGIAPGFLGGLYGFELGHPRCLHGLQR
jgi:hypothetical protein